MHELPNLHPMVAPSEPRHGEARPCAVCPGQALDHAATSAHLPETQACDGGCAGCPREVAGEVIESTREWWEIGLRVTDDEVAA